MKVLFTGDRAGFRNAERMMEVIGSLPEGTLVIHGACRGVDTQVDTIAKALGYPIDAKPADWRKYGRAAGPIRNRQMFDEHKPDLVIAFHHDLAHSKGTADMVKYAKSKGCEVRVYAD
jgi:hypothetical protein